jgi:hypothetical protein
MPAQTTSHDGGRGQTQSQGHGKAVDPGNSGQAPGKPDQPGNAKQAVVVPEVPQAPDVPVVTTVDDLTQTSQKGGARKTDVWHLHP